MSYLKIMDYVITIYRNSFSSYYEKYTQFISYLKSIHVSDEIYKIITITLKMQRYEISNFVLSKVTQSKVL